MFADIAELINDVEKNKEIDNKKETDAIKR